MLPIVHAGASRADAALLTGKPQHLSGFAPVAAQSGGYYRSILRTSRRRYASRPLDF
jgi:hypothetical protein